VHLGKNKAGVLQA